MDEKWRKQRGGMMRKVETRASSHQRFVRAQAGLRRMEQVDRQSMKTGIGTRGAGLGKDGSGDGRQDAGMVAMPFGEFKGIPLGEVRTGYLLWMLQQDWISKKHPGLLNEVWRVLKSRPGALER